MIQFLTGAGVALLAAALGFTAGSLQQALEKRRRRRALANAFLIDLRWLEAPLRRLYTEEYAGNNFGSLDGAVFERAGSEIYFFKTETMHILSYIYGLVRDLRDLFEAGRQNPNLFDPAIFHHRVRGLAGYAANAISIARVRLEEAGGSLPDDLAVTPVDYPNLPRLGPPTFP